MPFTSESARIEGAKGGHAAAESRKRTFDYFTEAIRNGHTQSVDEFMEKLKNGEQITPEQKEFLAHYKDFLPYAAGKRAQVDEKGKTANTIFISDEKRSDAKGAIDNFLKEDE